MNAAIVVVVQTFLLLGVGERDFFLGGGEADLRRLLRPLPGELERRPPRRDDRGDRERDLGREKTSMNIRVTWDKEGCTGAEVGSLGASSVYDPLHFGWGYAIT